MKIYDNEQNYAIINKSEQYCKSLWCPILWNFVTVFFWIVYIGKVCKRNHQRQWHETVLALATLGDATRNRNNPICVVPPKVAKASKKGLLRVSVADGFAVQSLPM